MDTLVIVLLSLVLLISIVNSLILIGLANFIVRSAAAMAQAKEKEEKEADASRVRVEDGGLLDVTSPQVTYDRQQLT